MRIFPWAIATLIFAMLFAGCRQEQTQSHGQQAALPKLEVAVAEVRLTPVLNQIEVLGTVASKYRAEIASKISGTISAMPVVLGSEVRRGDTLVEISAGEIDARLRQAQAQLQQARRNLDREKKLLAKSAATPETVKSLTELLTIAEAGYEEAGIMQSYTRITAPFNGRVTSKVANLGDLATPGKPLLVIEDETQLQILTDIPEAIILHIHKGDQLPVKLPSAGLSVIGTVAEVAPSANPATRSGAVKLDIAAHPNLRPGQFARVILSKHNTDTLTVPRQALIVKGQMEQLFVVDENVARLRLVRTGSHYGKDIEILAGVDQGDRVILPGHNQLRDGQPVTVQ